MLNFDEVQFNDFPSYSFMLLVLGLNILCLAINPKDFLLWLFLKVSQFYILISDVFKCVFF